MKTDNIFLFDSHAHLDDPRLAKDIEEILSRAREAGVTEILTVGAGIESAQAAVTIAGQHEGIYASAGIHPHEASVFDQSTEAELKRLCALAEVVALGEIGLDYHYDNSPRSTQRNVFERQLEMAIQLNMPVIVHCREAEDDCLGILSGFGGKIRGVAHCFAGNSETADALLDLGFYISFSGTVTFKNAVALAEIAAQIPEDRLMIETDCPYLAPHPKRGKTNEPSYVRFVAEKLAEARNTSLESVAASTTRNSRKIYGIS